MKLWQVNWLVFKYCKITALDFLTFCTIWNIGFYDMYLGDANKIKSYLFMLQPKIDSSKTIIGICHMTLTSGKVMYPSWVQFSRRKEPCILMNPGHWGSDMTERLHFHFLLSCIGERNGNPLQYSCLEDPRDGGDWWAAVYGVSQSWTRLKWLSSSSSSNA